MATIENAADRDVRPPRSKREIILVMSGLMITMLLAMLDNTIVGPALPTIVGDLGGLAHLSWVLTAYTLATAVSTLVWGKLGDLFGRKATFLSAIALFLTGSALTGMAGSMGELIGFRAIQGLGAGGLIVGVMAILGELVSPRERGKYQGYMMAIMPLAMLGGPLLGGWITDNVSWRWAFYVNLPLGIIAMITVWLTLHSPRRTVGKVFIDWWGALTLAVWTSALVLLCSWGGNEYAWDSWQIFGLGAIAAAGIIAFIIVETRVPEPLMPLHIFKNVNFSVAGVLSMVVGAAMMGTAAYLPQFQQLVQGDSATNSGLLLLPMMVPMMLTSMAIGQAVSRTGKIRMFPIMGGIALFIGMLLMSQLRVSTSTLEVSLFMIVVGLGVGGLMQPSSLIAQNSIRLRDMGAGMGANTFLRTIGMSLGTAIFGTIYTGRLTDHLTNTLGPAGAKFTSGGAQLPPSLMDKLPIGVQHAIQGAVTSGIDGIFMGGAIAAAIGLLVAFLLRDVELKGPETKPEPDVREAEITAIQA